jgi:hypothetical protein
LQQDGADTGYEQAQRNAENMPEPDVSTPARPGGKRRLPFPWMTLLIFAAALVLFCLVGVMAGWSGEDRGLGMSFPVAQAVDYLGGCFTDDLHKGRFLRLSTGALFFPTWLEFIFAIAFIFLPARKTERLCGPVTLLVSFVFGAAAGNALIALTLEGYHAFLSPFGGVIFGMAGLQLGCALRYRQRFPKGVLFGYIKNIAFWIGIWCLLLFIAFKVPWQFILDIPGGLAAGIICGFIFPVARLEDEQPIGGTVIKYLCLAAVIATLTSGFIQVASADAPVIEKFEIRWKGFSADRLGLSFIMPPGAKVESAEEGDIKMLTLRVEESNFAMGLFVRPFDGKRTDLPHLAKEQYEKRFNELRSQNKTVTDLQPAGYEDIRQLGISKIRAFMYGFTYGEAMQVDADGTRALVPRREYHYLIIRSGKTYRFIFTYTGRAPGETDFNSDMRDVIMNSIDFK